MSTPDVRAFDGWYASMARSARFDELVQRCLSLPAEVQSSGYLTGPGLLEVTERLALSSGSTLVELGCGRAGYGMAVVRARGARLIGIDFSAAALGAAGAQAHRLGIEDQVELRTADMVATGLPTGCADGVLSVDALHFARPPKAAAAESLRLLKPGGRFVVTTWQPAVPGSAMLPERLRDLDVRQDLLAVGFEDVVVDHRPEWSRAELALWAAVRALDPDGDPAIEDLVEEAEELQPLAPHLRRLLVSAVAPRQPAGHL